MSIEVRVPDIGDFKDVPVIEVLVKPGDQIKKDDPLVTLESDKAAFEVPAPSDGIVNALKVNVGDKVSQGTIILVLDAAQTPAVEDQVIMESPKPAASAPETPAPAQPQAAPAPTPKPPEAEPQRQTTTAQQDGSVHASPSIRRFARELGVDMHIVRGSGPNGRVTRDDVQRYVKTALQTQGGSGAVQGGAGLGIAPWPKIDFAQYGAIESKPLSRIKKLSGPNLHRNWVMIPHVTNNEDADITELEVLRKELNSENAKAGLKLTMLAFLIKAVVVCLQKFPDFNASLDGDNLVLKKYYNIGFAADTPGGLIVPVVKDADKKGVLDIARETAALSAKGRDGKLGPADMAGGTFTISSLGGIGGTYFTPIINAPEVAILGVCRAAMRPVWSGTAFEPRLILPLSLSYDHRVIDGAAAARFNVHLAALLGDMRRALL